MENSSASISLASALAHLAAAEPSCDGAHDVVVAESHARPMARMTGQQRVIVLDEFR